MRYLIIAGILLFGCANAQQSDQSVRAAIDAQNIKYEQGYLLRDVDMVLGVHTQDATVYPPNRIQAKGQSGIRQMIEGDLAFANPYILDLETISLEVHGDTAIEVGRYKAKLGLFDGTVIRIFLIVQYRWNRFQAHRFDLGHSAFYGGNAPEKNGSLGKL